VVWGNKNRVPKEIAGALSNWIPYAGGTWKSDLAIVPWLVSSNKIDLIHYWIAMGPIFRIGIAFVPFCKSLATVHDVGVENNAYDPYCAQTRTTWYWRLQKVACKRMDAITCNSDATRIEITRLLGGAPRLCDVIYPPIYGEEGTAETREAIFVTLGGSAHKNLANVIDAFLLFRQTHRDYKLVVCGEPGQIDVRHKTVQGVTFESMQAYPHILRRSAGLVVCSTYEGLGLPPIEAMTCGCPMVLSDIAPFHETCDASARFVDPARTTSIAAGLDDVAGDIETWSQRSANGYSKYRTLSGNAGNQWMALYNGLSR
jgi:glycosyltransferase involved in cell wall biosynthesis